MKRTTVLRFCTPTSPAGSRRLARKAAFTLPELLTVIAIIACLMTASFGAMRRARVLARRTKSEAQLRQLVSAWQQYYATYGKWPKTGQVDVDSSNLAPLTDPSKNDNHIVFFNYNGSGKFIDPVTVNGKQQQPYRLVFGSANATTDDRSKTKYETTVALPRRTTILP